MIELLLNGFAKTSSEVFFHAPSNGHSVINHLAHGCKVHTPPNRGSGIQIGHARHAFIGRALMPMQLAKAWDAIETQGLWG